MQTHFVALLVPLLVVIVLFGPLIERCEALSCPRCTPQNKAKYCKKVTCRYGITGDICGCCEACYKGENESCGGIWNQGGTCAPSLELVCEKNKISWQQPGKCVKSSPIIEPNPDYYRYE